MKLALAQEETPSWVEKTEHQVQLLLSKLGEQVEEESLPSDIAIAVEVVSSETVDDEEEEEFLDFDWDEIPTVHYTANKYLQAVEEEDQEEDEDEDEEEILDWQEGWELELF